MQNPMANLLTMLLITAAAQPLTAQMIPAAPVMESELSTEQAEIFMLETRWREAFLDQDYEFIEKIVAPEFRLVIHEGAPLVVPREPWMENTRRWDFVSFPIEVFDILVSGDTAVAVVKGRWKVDYNGERIHDNAFFLTDTWVRRDGKWQVIRRHSQSID